MKISSLFLCCIAAVCFTGCASYKANIMFKVPDEYTLQQQTTEAEKNYILQKNDYLRLEVYTNKGEIILDPENKLQQEMPAQVTDARPEPTYLVDVNGVVKFPMIQPLNIEGLTIRQAEEILEKEYSKFYTDAFVILTFTNKRVVVLGAPKGQVVPLVNENVTLVEVIALAGGVGNDARANHIRVLRGPEVFLADLSTAEGYKKYNMIMQPGDIVYVEPIRRPFSEALQDYAMVVSMVTSLTTLIVVLTTL
jgi:polysaccharide export outer membrane protein